MTADGPTPPPRSDLLAGYEAGPLDEAIEADGTIRPGYVAIFEAMTPGGIEGLRLTTKDLDRRRVSEGISFIAEIDGVLTEQPFPLDPMPRVIGLADWDAIRAGLQQRARALNAFLDDVYGELRIVR
ncbi:MAG TPA: circularly permuted type 2 ATP-grasp protein, partial [Nakamurella multipartita]|nr:circularly permuted type 2 ATP-grasp protein [Nakamurella multipartita]